METTIIEILQREGKPILPETLLEQLEDKAGAAVALERLLAEGRLLLTRKKKLALPEQTGLVYGRVQGHARGYGFFLPEDGSQDAFLPADAMHGALHGDRVWARLTDQVSRNGSPEAEVALVAVRAWKRVVGSFESDRHGGGYVVPDETRIPQDVLIRDADTNGAKPGDKVVVEILQYPDGRRPMLGTVVEVLGGKYDAGTDILSIIRQYDLPAEFSKGAKRQAKALKLPDADAIARREDLRGQTIITIDGADAKDLDDAVSLTPLQCGNLLLGVHIADVSAYVPQGGLLDREAYARGTSVYLLDRVIPMFPPELCDGVCSLTSGTDKLALSLLMEVNKEGRVVRHRFAETVINTRHRMVYEDVSRMLEGDEALQQQYADVYPMLEQMKALQAVLYEKRVKRGSIDFDLTEAQICLDEHGKPTDIAPAERGIANRIIEEFMLLANETVAEHLSSAGLPCLYRVHEPPDGEKLTELNAFLQSLGYGFKNARDIQPRAFQKVLLAVKGKPEENVVNRVTLRSLKRARYCEQSLGHFGLASKYYCHFTSPIRRYPDLVVHRIVKAHLCGELNPKQLQKLTAELPEVARHTSEREKIAAEAERAVDDLKKCEYMQSRIGSVYPGLISGVINFGFFVELLNTVEGMVRLQSLDDDYYSHDSKNHRMIGRSSGKSYRLGDSVQVQVAGVDLDARNVEFVLAKPGAQKIPGQGAVPKGAGGKANGIKSGTAAQQASNAPQDKPKGSSRQRSRKKRSKSPAQQAR